MIVTILYPLVKDSPNGGLKVLYDYAHKLSLEGHIVNFVYSAYFKELDVSLVRKTKSCIKYLYMIFKLRNKGYSWYLDKHTFNDYFVYEYKNNNIPKADLYIATSATTAFYLNRLLSNSRIIYFIQGYENFILKNEALIHLTYCMPFQKIVISNWLQRLLRKDGQESLLIPNGYDKNQYHITIPIKEKNKYYVSMLYHKNPDKRFALGLEILKTVKKQIPELHVFIFGTFNKPKLPEWCSYYKEPTAEQHLAINNECAIYLGPSINEGWGLTVGEAMMCGQAVVCTNNKGYMEMVEDRKNAFVSKIDDVHSMANDIVELIKNDFLRWEIANNAYSHIQKFDINNSYKKFLNILLNE